MTARDSFAMPEPRSVGGIAAVAGPMLALGALLGFAMAPAGWRLGLWYYDVSFAIMRYAAYVALVAAAVSCVALFGWMRLSPWRRAATLGALAIAAVVVAVPWHYARLAATTPPIHDITTDPVDPPPFWAVLPSRLAENANAVEYGGPAVAKLQRAYYPRIAPVITPLPPRQAFAVAFAVAQSMPGWIDVIAEPGAWRIEASQESFWMRFTDDVSIRIASQAAGSRIDVRSLSRQGRGDFGVNAARVTAYLEALEARLAAVGSR
ncbi:MAG: DUF1499 domain-containing protein [Alphaproteobacteria bacterium]|nr:DUF1499 domain-containing protein [Alphaproteobacteria bacterium]